MVTSTSCKLFEIRDTITCDTANVIYAVVCAKCNATVYVGETERPLKKRKIDHLSTTRPGKDTTVATHFNSRSHGLCDFRVIGIESVSSLAKIYRQLREKLWIKLLRTTTPAGLNEWE
jgi:hypothetical protein